MTTADMRALDACHRLEAVALDDPNLLRILACVVQTVIAVDRGGSAPAVTADTRERLLAALQRARGMVASLEITKTSPLREHGVCFDCVDQLIWFWSLTPEQRQAVSPLTVEDARDFADLLVSLLGMGAAMLRLEARPRQSSLLPVVH